ncbi:hypothetical protein [Geminocystis herdmanii]|uniref:hypothetical protein n=1 Tax=Geminocystis herdmanii TaxID=669359 RepID=UPI000348F081|nr:hypothetical protein [Geminocystis herdmanii]
MSQHSSSISEILGTVGAIFDDNKFILETDNGQISIEADIRDYLALNLTSGERVTVRGSYDDNDFEAVSIIREDGSPVLTADILENDPYDDHSNDLDDNYHDNSNDLDDNYHDNSNNLDDNYYDNSNNLDDNYHDNSNNLDDNFGDDLFGLNNNTKVRNYMHKNII